jgi:lipoprotein-anchoring transpeptidase ErfK/SrfK
MRRSLGFTLRALVFSALAFVTPAYAYETVPLPGYQMGIVVVKTGECNLYYVVGTGEAIRYPVAGSCSGTQWKGPAQIKDTRIGQDVQNLFRRARVTTVVVEP